MIVSAFSDNEKKDKVAEFYDTTYPCSFMRGLLTESQEQEKDLQITFVARQERGVDLSLKEECSQRQS